MPVSPTFTPGGWGILSYVQGLEKPRKPHLVQWHGLQVKQWSAFSLLPRQIAHVPIQIFWSEMGFVFQVACCKIPPELPEYPPRIITTASARHGTATKIVDYE